MNKNAKIVGIIICLIPTIGFGLCGLLGVGSYVSEGSHSEFSPAALWLGLIGLGISAVFGFVVWAILRSMKNKTSEVQAIPHNDQSP